MGLPRLDGVRLNCLCTGVGRFLSFMHKWGLASTSLCECSALDQTAAHAILECSLHHAPEDTMNCWSRMMRLYGGPATLLPTSEENLLEEEDEIVHLISHFCIIGIAALHYTSNIFSMHVCVQM